MLIMLIVIKKIVVTVMQINNLNAQHAKNNLKKY